MTEAANEVLKQRVEAFRIIDDEGVADVFHADRRWLRLRLIASLSNSVPDKRANRTNDFSNIQ
jgi:hypothetical protein